VPVISRPSLAAPAAAIAIALALGLAAPAGAAIEISTPAPGAMAVATTAGDTVAVDCAVGRVRVSEQPTAVACAALERLDVDGDALPNRIDLRRVGAEFASLEHRGVAGRGGGDAILGSPGADWLRGGAGHDALDGGAGDDHLDVYLGDGGDLLAGGEGDDAVAVFGSNLADTVAAVADGRDLHVVRRAKVLETSTLDASVERLSVHGLGGDDHLSGPQTHPVHLFADGNQGDDTVVGGEGADDLHGGAGADRLDGAGGDDVLLAGEGDDTLLWRAGDGLDVLGGGAGTDTAEALGARGVDRWTIAPNGLSARLDAGTALPSGLKGEHVERLEADAGAGDDTITGGLGLAGRIALVQRGGPGDDVLTGGDGDDRQQGGPGLDLLAGAEGADAIDAADGARDRVACGAGLDLALADPFDVVGECETVAGG
jgi:Ca2+-binding RTX toxin-like protein